MYPKVKIIIFIIIGAFAGFVFFRPLDLSRRTKDADEIVTRLLKKNNVHASNLLKETHEFKKYGRYRFETTSKTYRVNPDFPFDSFRNVLSEQLSDKHLKISSWGRNIKDNTFYVDINFKKMRVFSILFRLMKKEAEAPGAFKKAKVAIVIDDFGYNLNEVNSWVKFAVPITFSILPHLSYSTRIDNLAAASGKEVILHLPMEPHNEEAQPREKESINTSMSKAAMLGVLNRAMKVIPHLKGVSNHQGSKATEDTKTIATIFAELKKKDLFFLDSMVTSKSVCYAVALQTGLKFVQRDIFLDNVNEVEYIKNQLNKLTDLAQAKGFAVGIGHNRPRTLEALIAMYGAMEARGIEFVYLSDLVK